MLRLHLFGTPVIEQAGVILPRFKNREAEALLFYLAVRPGQHEWKRLATLLWSELPPGKALSNLRHTLWTIRHTLGDHILLADRVGVAFQTAAEIWIDAVAFRTHVQQAGSAGSEMTPAVKRAWQQAAALYRGDFLADVDVAQAPLFDEWLQQQRSTFHHMAIDLFTRLAGYYTHHHYLPEAIAATRRWLEMEPWQETAHRRLMLLLSLSGQRGAALDHYRQCREILATELDLDPEPETVALMERIREGRLQPPSYDPARSEADPPMIPLLGRHTEFAWLVERWERTRGAPGKLALIRGEAGAGKTRLIEELTYYVTAQGGLTLTGRCYEFSGPMSYQPLAAALQAHITRVEQPDWDLREMWLTILAQLVPAILEHHPHVSAPPGGEQGFDRYRLFEAVAHFLLALAANQPVLFVLEDLHWADADTLDLLSYLVRRLTDAPVLIAGTYRQEELGDNHLLLNQQRTLFKDGLIETLDLAGLSPESVEKLVQTAVAAVDPAMPVADMDNLSASIYRRCRGNPFLLFEILREVEEQGWLRPASPAYWRREEAPFQQESFIPGGVKTRIQRRLARLPRESRRLLALAAVIGGPFDLKLLQEAGSASPESSLDYLDDWLARHLIAEINARSQHPDDVPAGGGRGDYDFSHDLIRAVVYRDLSPARRQILHRRIGTALERIYAGRLDQVIPQLAHHFHHSADSPQALVYLHQAGRRAEMACAFHLAQTYYQRALDHWETYYPQARTRQTRLPLEAWRQRWEMLLRQAEVGRLLGQMDQYRATLETAAREMADWGDARDALLVVEAQMAHLEPRVDLEERRRLAETGLNLAQTMGQPLLTANFLQALANCERDMGRLGEALAHYEEALTLFFQWNQTRQATFCLVSVGSIHLMTDKVEEAMTCFGRAVAYAQAEKSPDSLTWAYHLMAYIRENLGRM